MFPVVCDGVRLRARVLNLNLSSIHRLLRGSESSERQSQLFPKVCAHQNGS